MNIKLPFGIRDDELVHINDLNNDERGLKCNCICPCCNNPLIARLGSKNIKHFSHTSSDCENGLESALHLYAKDFISTNLELRLPKYEILYNNYCYSKQDFIRLYRYFKGYSLNSDFLYDSNLNNLDDTNEDEDIEEDYDLYSSYKTQILGNNSVLKFDSCDIEKRINDFVPDIILYKNDNPLIIEVKVTHGIDSDKYLKIKKSNMSCVEINLDLEDLNRHNFEKSYINDLMVNCVDNKTWIFNIRAEEEKRKIINSNKEFLKRQKDIIEKKLQSLPKSNKKISSKDNKINRIKSLLSYEIYNNNLLRYETELHKSLWWKEFISKNNIPQDNIPPYLNYIIDRNIVFNCDRRIWQSIIFSKFILNRQGKYFKICNVVTWVKKYASNTYLKLNRDLIYIKDIEHVLTVKDLTDVIIEYFNVLKNYGYLNKANYTNGYYAEYEILKGYVDIGKTGYTIIEEVINVKPIYTYSTSLDSPIYSNNDKELNLPPINPIEEEPKFKNSVLVNDRYGTCKICGEYTANWIIYDGSTQTCTCTECHYKDDLRYSKA